MIAVSHLSISSWVEYGSAGHLKQNAVHNWFLSCPSISQPMLTLVVDAACRYSVAESTMNMFPCSVLLFIYTEGLNLVFIYLFIYWFLPTLSLRAYEACCKCSMEPQCVYVQCFAAEQSDLCFVPSSRSCVCRCRTSVVGSPHVQ